MTNYELAQRCCDLISFARGLPPGTISAEDMEVEQIHAEMDELSVALTAQEWAMMACIVLLDMQEEDHKQLSNQVFYPWIRQSSRPMFPYKSYAQPKRLRAFKEMMDGGVVDLKAPVDYHIDAYSLMKERDGVKLNSDERAAALTTALSNRFSRTRLRAMVTALTSFKRISPEQFLKQMIAEGTIDDAVERRNKLWEVERDTKEDHQ